MGTFIWRVNYADSTIPGISVKCVGCGRDIDPDEDCFDRETSYYDYLFLCRSCYREGAAG